VTLVTSILELLCMLAEGKCYFHSDLIKLLLVCLCWLVLSDGEFCFAVKKDVMIVNIRN